MTFAARHLDPGSRLGELLFGLIMTLTFTLGAGIVIQEEGREGAKEMLVAILGCNLAWGIIDGVLYALSQVFERGRLRRVGLNVRAAPAGQEAQRVVAAELDDLLGSFVDESERSRFYTSVAERLRTAAPAANGIRRSDLLGGLAAGWLVFACSFPAVLPFLFMDDPRLALRVSNAILLGLLFLVGYRLARETTAKPWIAGTVVLLMGVLLVALAIPLGG